MLNRNKPVQVPIGMRRSWFFPIASEPANARPTYGAGQDMGAARLGTLTTTTAAADIEGDDMVLVHVENFVTGQLVAETTLNDLELNALVYGHTYSAGVSSSNKDDQSPPGGYAFIEPLLKKDKSTVYRATFLLKVSANPANEAQSANTRQGNSINPTYNSITYTVFSCNSGEWRLQQDFASESDAEAWILGIAGATTVWEVSVEIIGNGSVSPAGSNYHTAGQNVVLDFGDTDPTVLYDGTTNKTSSISSHKYTISSIAAPHHLVAVFAAS